jgi:MFS family permease
MSSLSSRRRLAILVTVCLAVFAINLDTTIVNVALPDLARELAATTRDLQWIVDGYNLAFAALVLVAGSIGDRFGRRPALLTGLVGFAVASGLGALVTGAGALVVVRLVMGAFAALIFRSLAGERLDRLHRIPQPEHHELGLAVDVAAEHPHTPIAFRAGVPSNPGGTVALGEGSVSSTLSR